MVSRYALPAVKRRKQFRGIALALSLAMLGQTPGFAQHAAVHSYAMPSQPLGTALNQLALSSDKQILVPPDLVRGRTAPALVGQYTLDVALQKLLAGSGLTYEVTDTGTVVIKRAPPAAKPRSTKVQKQQPAAEKAAPPTTLQAVTVTGTRIRGAAVAGPVVTITSDEIHEGGFNNLGEVARSIPQNFAGGQNPGVTLGATSASNSNQNISSGSAFDLRGLGPGATLTLLNGSRLSYEGPFEARDVSSIPVVAIDRVEVLLDGASAIYGSDAVAGVANVILKRDYNGAQLSARYGVATDGGYAQSQYTGIGGNVWNSGGFLIAADVSHNSAVSAKQRNYLGNMPQDADIYPSVTQKSVLFSGHEELGSYTTFKLDALYSNRTGHQLFISPGSNRNPEETGAESFHVSPELDVEIQNDWLLRLHVDLNRDTSKYRNTYFSIASGQVTSFYHEKDLNEDKAFGLDADGPLFSLPAGDMRLSVGGGWRKSKFASTVTGAQAEYHSGDNTSYYGYAETDLPVVSAAQALPLVSRLSLNGAIRYEHYDSFGATTTPKLGVIWSVIPGFDIKGSWARSFKAPTLLQQYQPFVLYYYPSYVFAGAPADGTMFIEWGGNRNLKPERATIRTAGFAITPELLHGLNIEFTWFDIRYTDRVVQAFQNFLFALVDPASKGFLTTNPSIDQLNAAFVATGFPVGTFFLNEGNPDFSSRPYNPLDVHAIINDRYVNAAADHISGIDLSVRYVTQLLGGDLSLAGNGTWLLTGTRKVTSVAPGNPIIGRVFFPAKFKGRLTASWSRDGLTLSSALNRISGVRNNLVTPIENVSSMTTADLVMNFDINSVAARNTSVNVAVLNVFNQRPPYMRPTTSYYPSFDSTNYFALGRTINFTVTKRF